MVLPNNLTGIRKQINVLAGNIAGAKALGAKEQETLFNVSYADNGNVSYVQDDTRINISKRGPLVTTGERGDIALSNGNAMLPFKQNVNDPNNQEFRYKGTASLRIDKDGYLSTRADGTGYKLMGFKIDENGNLPATTLLSSLTAVSVKDAILRPEATTIIAVDRLRLDSSKETLHGPGDVIKINRGNFNANLKKTDIIIPEDNAFSGLRQGDRLQLVSTPPGGETQIFEYGGIVVSKKINAGTGGFYGRTTTGGQFTFAADTNPQTPTNLKRGNAISITFNGTTTTLAASDSGADQTFSSLEGLKTAISKFVPGLTANIKDGRIFIAPDDTATPTAANGAITFANANGGNLVSTLGLVDIVPADVGVQRFATLKTLQERVNLNNINTGLKADFVGTSANLDLHALIAKSTLQLDGSSPGIRSFSRATIGANFAAADGGADRGRATVTIESPKHDLKQGDKLWITGIANPGFYMVNEVPNNDFFTISLINNNPATFPAAAAPTTYAVANGTWQKVASEKFLTNNTTSIGTTAGGNVTLSFPGAVNLANDDVVYISGFGSRPVGGQNPIVPDGYYVVRNRVAGPPETIQIVPSGGVAAAVAVGPQAFSVSVTKVGVGAAGNFGPDNFNSRTMTTNTGQAVGGNTVRIFLPNTNYNIGDTFRLSGLVNPLVIDGITLNNTDSYSITNKDALGNWIDFTVPATAGTAAAANVNVIYGNAAGAAPNTLRTNDYGLTSKYLGLQNQTAKVFNATYSITDPTMSISNIGQDSKHIGKTFNTAIVVYDSLGGSHELLMTFARLEDNYWAVEIAGVANANGDYDFVTTRPDGVIVAGDISFDENGNFSESSIRKLTIDWITNGSLPGDITLDWNDLLNGKGITQFDGDSLADNIKPNGHAIGTVANFDIDEDGKIYAIFDNGERVAIYQVPVAVVANIDGMEGTTDGMFIPGPLSGAIQLRIAGTNGAPTLISKVVESSGVDNVKSILMLNEIANLFRAEIGVIRLDDDLTKEAIQKIG